jgi:hypothetical protein
MAKRAAVHVRLEIRIGLDSRNSWKSVRDGSFTSMAILSHACKRGVWRW